MTGYSGTPLAAKLGIERGHRVLLDGAPDEVDVKVCAVDETWSGLAFVVRVADRTG